MEFSYINEIKRLLQCIETEEHAHMQQAVDILTAAILKKHSIFTFGASHAGILSEELYYRAGGMVIINPIFGRGIMLDTSPITHTSHMERLIGYGTVLANATPFQKGDVLLAHSVSGRNPVTIEIAMEAKNRGVTVISITNVSYSKEVTSRHPSGHNLYEISDVVIDNHGEKGDACITIEGLDQKVSPTSTVIGASIVNSIVAATTQELVHHGMKKPPIFYSANIDHGDELNKQIFEEYKDVIHYKF